VTAALAAGMMFLKSAGRIEADMEILFEEYVNDTYIYEERERIRS
jgi:hypothetical protein